jgi:hypothetical protein
LAPATKPKSQPGNNFVNARPGMLSVATSSTVKIF